MKYIYILLLFVSSVSLAHEDKEAHKFECNGEKDRKGVIDPSYFNREERNIVESIRRTDMPLVFEEFNQKPHGIDQEDAVEIGWDQAKRIILMGFAKSVLQDSNPKPHAYILGRSGHTYIATPPTGKSVYVLASVVDPCAIYIDGVMY